MGFPMRFNLCIYHHCNNNINIMSCMDDQQPNFKHYCRVCKKGFMCGRALGGHMRAHGVGDVNWKHEDDDEDEDDNVMSDWEEKFRSGSEIRVDNKRMYQLRTNPNRLKSCRTCENCGKEFLSWKSFLDHGKCSSGDGDASESLVSSPESEGEGEDDVGRCSNNGWSKRKRTLRSKVGCLMDSTPYVPTEEDDLFLARCLVQLANSTVVIAEAEESSASASRDEERRNNAPPYHAKPMTSRATFEDKAKGISSNPKGLFECKACKKVFNSHQALGGHRASHKKVKGCFAAKQDQIDEQNNTLGGHHQDNHVVITSDQFEQGQAHVETSRKKSKVHECTICHRVFASGQALGGHKRCHWITSNAPPSPSLKFHFQDNLDHNNIQTPSDKLLDLNVPAWAAHGFTGVQKDPQNLLSFKVSTDHQMNLRPWIGHETRNNTRYLHQHQHQHLPSKHSINQGNNSKNNNAYIDDEADSKLKLAKLSDLHDLKDKMGDSGNSSPWLQVGIGTTTESATITTATTATTTASMDANA